MMKHDGLQPGENVPAPDDFTFPAKSHDEIKTVMYCPNLKRYYLSLLNLEALTLPEAAEQMATKMAGHYTELTRALYFTA